jgi:heat-inducible transcriptional repressor
LTQFTSPVILAWHSRHESAREGDVRTVLTDKQTRILEAVVTSHIRTGLPVGSSYLCRRSGIDLCPASVRQAMSELESLGLLAKPHVSAGRVPTEAGYRLYVGRFAKPYRLTAAEARAIRTALVSTASVGDALERVSRLLESLSHITSVALAPEMPGGRITRFRTRNVSESAVLATIVVEPGEARRFGNLRRWLAEVLGGRCQGAYVFGVGNIVPEIKDPGEAKLVLRVFESRDSVSRAILAGMRPSGVTVTIGSDNQFTPMKGFSVVRSPYWVGRARGAIGLVGPLRMEYSRLITLIDFASRQLTSCLSDQGGQRQSAN